MPSSSSTFPRITRRRLILGSIATAGVACSTTRYQSGQVSSGAIVGDAPDYAHRIRSKSVPTPSSTNKTTVAIVGGGVAGLSAAWRLVRSGVDGVTLFELSDVLGGTARAGAYSNEPEYQSRYPWGAHYLPVPNRETSCIIRLCREVGLISGSKSQPKFHSRHLVHAPEDRLFYRGHWYDSLYLSAGASNADLEQLERFSNIIETWTNTIGADGRPAFALPAALSSTDPELIALDSITASTWLKRHNLVSERLRWYCNYAVLDDYGADLETVSAWSLLHYFAGRRPLQTPETEGSHYFTWPEGNGHLVEWLAAQVPAVKTQRLVLRASQAGELVVWNPSTQEASRWLADHIILAVPNHAAAHMVPGRAAFADHAPWLVANLVLRNRPKNSPSGWNHVLYEGRSQGYIDAKHQAFQPTPSTTWTWYQPMPTTSRGFLYRSDWRTLSGLPIADLRPAYGDLRPLIQHMDVMRWGHGTVIPRPGLIHGSRRSRAAQSVGRIHFAHTDYSGLPLFEEANYRGVLAAEAVLTQMGVSHEAWAVLPGNA